MSTGAKARRELHLIIMMRVRESIGGVWELLLIGIRSGFRTNNAYWTWRKETAFGSDPSRWPPLRERVRAMLEYGRWVHRMKRRR